MAKTKKSGLLGIGKETTTGEAWAPGGTIPQYTPISYVENMTEQAQRPNIESWWITTSRADREAFLPKLAEYGATDLDEIGANLDAFRGEHRLPHDGEHGELGCMFYLFGKVARAMAAYQRGELPSDDTLHDITVYSMMARAYRERGNLT